jgi:preprotein translocase subunit Sec63
MVEKMKFIQSRMTWITDGREPVMSDIVLYMRNWSLTPYYISRWGEITSMTHPHIHNCTFELTIPLLKDQSEELIDWLFNLD